MPNKISDKVAKAVALYKSRKDLSVKEICQECEVSISALHNIRKKYNIEKREKTKSRLNEKSDIEKINKFISESSIDKTSIPVPDNFFTSKKSKKVSEKPANKKNNFINKDSINEIYGLSNKENSELEKFNKMLE